VHWNGHVPGDNDGQRTVTATFAGNDIIIDNGQPGAQATVQVTDQNGQAAADAVRLVLVP
jgi:predicted fused transcriptional regulator/phosphomethylpyrimidine kinase